jgi:choline kinase
MLAAKADTATTYTRTVLDNKLGAKADTATTYTRDALTKMLAAKADTATTYTRTVLDNKLGAKADTATTYTRDALNKMLAAKADTATTYTRDALNKMLAAKADTATTYTREALNKMLGAKADTSDVYTRVALDTMLAAKADTSDIHNAKVTIKSALSADPIKEFTLNTEVDQEINLPANPLTLKFVNGSDTVFSYNAFKDQTAEPGVVDNYFVIDLGDSLSTKAIVRYINGAKANTAVNDVDSIYNALANNADVKKALLAKAKEVAKNHRRDAIDVAISYFKNLSSDDIRYILNNVSSTDIANFVSKLSTTLTSTDVNNIISGLTSSITAAQVENLIDALNNSSTGITPAQVNHFIDYLNNAANANPSSAAGVLKARLDAHINALIEAH